jgi:hypothetical protein
MTKYSFQHRRSGMYADAIFTLSKTFSFLTDLYVTIYSPRPTGFCHKSDRPIRPPQRMQNTDIREFISLNSRPVGKKKCPVLSRDAAVNS